MKTLLSLLMLLAFTAGAQQINPGFTFPEGPNVRITADQLNALVNQATITPFFYINQIPANAQLQPGDTLLVLSSGNTYHKILGSQVFNNTNMFTTAVVETNVPPYGVFIFYDPTNGWVAQIGFTNLAFQVSSNLVVSNFQFAATNALSSNQLVQVLPPSPYTLSPILALQPATTNDTNFFLTWDTNGIPFYTTFSNIMAAEAPYFGTNISNGVGLTPYEFLFTFKPYNYYTTNTTTNAWGLNTNFPITSLFFYTNNVTPTNPVPTLQASDPTPINSGAQGTNTSVTLGALFQYNTNQYPQPPYTVAREQFNGTAAQVPITNVDTINLKFFAGTNGIPSNTVQAISFFFTATTGGRPTTLPTVPQVFSNVIYYAVSMATNPNWIQLYTNYFDAFAANTNVIKPSGTASVNTNDNKMLVISNSP